AGEDWDSLVETAVRNDWAGFECLSGIPGRVGATPVQNVGAYGQETSETLSSVEALDLVDGELISIERDDCEVGYRTSRFKTRDKDRFVITRVHYALAPHGTAAVRYPELERHLRTKDIARPSLVETRCAVLELRRNKSMVIDPADPNSKSAGSFFVNPVISEAQFAEVQRRASARGITGEITSYPQRGGGTKLPAAWLIERAGIARGFTHGNAGTSTRHALAIINRGGATARELLELMQLIQDRVRDVFGIDLVPEPAFIGFDR